MNNNDSVAQFGSKSNQKKGNYYDAEDEATQN